MRSERVSSARRRGGGAIAVGVGVWLVAQWAAAAPPPEHVALTNARIIPVAGAEIGKGTVLISRGKIAAVGESVEVPFDAKVIDLTGKVVMPGMIDVHTARGLDVANEMRPVTPFLDVYDAIDPSQLAFEDMLRNGVTSVHVIPGNNTVIGGVGRICRPIGLNVAEMTQAEGVALKLSITPRGGWDRLTQLATLRETFAELDDYLERLAEKRYEEELTKEGRKLDVGPGEARKRGRALIRAEDIDDKHRNLLRLRGESGVTDRPPLGRLGAFVYCGEAMDVGLAVKLAKDNHFLERTVLVLGPECWKAVKELKAAARPVVLPPELVHRETHPLTGKVTETFVASRIAEAGLLWALVPGPDGSPVERLLNYQAARCVRNGISRDEALKAITLNPARILGLESRLGSIEPGKDGNVAVLSGDPLDFNSEVEKVFIDGILAYEREKDVRLQRLLKGAETQPGATK